MKDYKHLKLQEPEPEISWDYYLIAGVAICIMFIEQVNF